MRNTSEQAGPTAIWLLGLAEPRNGCGRRGLGVGKNVPTCSPSSECLRAGGLTEQEMQWLVACSGWGVSL